MCFSVPFLRALIIFSGVSVVSREKDMSGRPLLHLSPPLISVLSFSQLSKLLQVANERKLKEVRSCLEGKLNTHCFTAMNTTASPVTNSVTYHQTNRNTETHVSHISTTDKSEPQQHLRCCSPSNQYIPLHSHILLHSTYLCAVTAQAHTTE